MYSSSQDKMAQVVDNDDGEIHQRLPPQLQFLHHADTTDIVGWLWDNKRKKDTHAVFPAVWKLLETRLREHPDEAIEKWKDTAFYLSTESFRCHQI